MVTFSSAALEAWLAGWLLPFFRVLALFTAAPIFNSRAVPARVRIAASAAIAFVAAPLAPVPALTTGGGAALALSSATGLAMVAQQLAIGLALGFAVRLLMSAFETAGEVIGLQMGLSFAGFVNPQGGSQPAVASWLHTLAMLLFLSLNAHLLVLDALLATFRSLPIAAQPLETLAAIQLVPLGADVFRLALTLSLPAIALVALINMALGLASRIAPQLSIFSVGFPLTLLAGIGLLAAGSGHLAEVLVEALPVFLGPFR